MKKLFKILPITILLSGPALALAASYTLLEPSLFGTTATTTLTFIEYANKAFKVLLSLTIGLAILFIVIGGIEYTTSALPNVKSDGKERIKGALWGLFIALLSYLVLYTINPELVKWDLKIDQLGGGTKTSEPKK